MILLEKIPPIRYRCPVCGLPYRSSMYRSGGMLGYNAYSDGSVDRYDFNTLWLTRCPRCKSFFAKRHLVLCEEIEDTPVSGSVDYRLNGTESRYELSFWEEARQKGLFLPPHITEAEKESFSSDVLLGLWRAANRQRRDFGEGKYRELCHSLLTRIKPLDTERRLHIAELYRNLGDFDAALSVLGLAPKDHRHIFRAYAIERTAKIGYRETVKLKIM